MKSRFTLKHFRPGLNIVQIREAMEKASSGEHIFMMGYSKGSVQAMNEKCCQILNVPQVNPVIIDKGSIMFGTHYDLENYKWPGSSLGEKIL